MSATRETPDAPRAAILLINTGSPAAPEAGAVREYLAEFLSDTRVIELPKWKWWPILHGIILRVRPAKSAERYRGVWLPEGSPLIVHTERTAARLQAAMDERTGGAVRVAWAMRYGRPAADEVFRGLVDSGIERVLVMPLFAQYAAQTSAACLDRIFETALTMRSVPAIRTVRDYHLDEGYIGALVEHLRNFWAREGDPRATGGRLVMSFHGIPAKSSELGDVYERHCHETAARLAERLMLAEDEWSVCFQSRFGRDEWLQPYTLPFVEGLGREGVARVDVICPGFAADCLETIEEIGDELKRAYLTANPTGTFKYIPALNATDEAIRAYTEIAMRELSGWVSGKA
ncbi:ferrochelatase [Sutterella sp.]|uniref:ferrochelatase n=1 Tax=Sutterella sp. TaxID=1981025 RepID=UPI0026DEF429|nr:ferrochelatase [Sutterella sp.]MDO5530649.1 ferrochelatase [Sutterella sp.]